ncbi:hypothetical protein Tco_1143608 [Tanacetum coccineum]
MNGAGVRGPVVKRELGVDDARNGIAGESCCELEREWREMSEEDERVREERRRRDERRQRMFIDDADLEMRGEREKRERKGVTEIERWEERRKRWGKRGE